MALICVLTIPMMPTAAAAGGGDDQCLLLCNQSDRGAGGNHRALGKRETTVEVRNGRAGSEAPEHNEAIGRGTLNPSWG